MFALPYPQSLPDWLTQYWNIALGRKAQVRRDSWLFGPMGEIGGVGEKIIEQIAKAEGLRVVRSASPAGLLPSADAFGALTRDLHPDIIAFYTQTSEFEMEAWTKWQPFWGAFGRLVDRMFARRIDQLRLPSDSLETSRGMTSEVVLFIAQNGEVRYRLWLRKLVATGAIVYSGFYSGVVGDFECPRIKVVFPLPKGSATVVMLMSVDALGRLRLSSHGTKDGDSGFYFLVEDRKKRVWINYLKSFQEFIDVYLDSTGELRADHTMRLWGRLVYSLHYKMKRRANPEGSANGPDRLSLT